MTRLNDQFGGGLDPLQDHSAAGQQQLDTRLTRYAVRIKDVNGYTQPVIEAGSAGDVVGATLWPPESRAIAGWSHAWPVTGGSPVQASGMSSSKADGAVLSSIENPKPKKKRTSPGSGGSLRIGIDAGGDFTVIGGQGLPRTFGLPDGVFLGIQAQPINFGSFVGNGAFINDATGYFSNAQMARKDAIRNGWSPRGSAGPGGAAGAAGGLGGAGAFGAGGSVPPGLRSITGDGVAPPAFIVYRPIHDRGYNEDRTFSEDGQALPTGFPSLPGGTVGVRLGGTYAHNQQPVYVHGDPRMVSVNEGPDPAAGSMVLDTNARGEYDPARWARLQSAWRVSPQITGDINYGKGGTLAWQLARGERDGVCGYGTIVDLGSLRMNGAAASPTTPSAGAANPSTPGGTGGTTGVIANQSIGSDRQLSSAVVRAGSEAAMAYSITLKTGAKGAAPGTDERRAAARNEPRLTYAFTSARQGGPLEVGHAHRDKHVVGKAGDANVNIGHLSARALFYADPVRDGPLMIEKPLYPKVETFPLKAQVHCQFRTGRRPELSGDGKTNQAGVFDWWAEVPNLNEGGDGGGDPPPPTTGPPAPPPTKPPATKPDYPYPAPGLLSPPLPVQPPITGPRGRVQGLVGGAGGGSSGGLGSTIGVMVRNPAFAYRPGPIEPIADVAPLPETPRPFRADYVRQRVTAAGRTDQVTGFAAATGHTVILGRPQELDPLAPDFRNANDHDGDEVFRVVTARPVTARLEAWGGRTGGDWVRNQRRGTSRYTGGTGAGGWLMLPPELDMKDVEAGSYSVTPSTSYFAAYAGTWFGAGTPVLSTGALKTGARWGFDGTSFVLQGLSSASAAVTGVRVKTDGTPGLRESGGTILDIAGITDGEFLKRSGSTIISGTPTASLDITGLTAESLVDRYADYVPMYDASAGANRKVRVRDLASGAPVRSTTHYDVGPSDASEQTIFTGTVPANCMGTDRMLRLAVRGTAFNQTGSGRLFQIRLKFGGSTLVDCSINLASSATLTTFWVDVEIQNDAATGAQNVTLRATLPVGSAPATGTAGGLVGAAGIRTVEGTGAVDTTSDQTLAVTLQLPVSDANLYADIERGMLELI